MKLWLAETFGWHPDDVDNQSWDTVENLIMAWNSRERRRELEAKSTKRKWRK